MTFDNIMKECGLDPNNLSKNPANNSQFAYNIAKVAWTEQQNEIDRLRRQINSFKLSFEMLGESNE